MAGSSAHHWAELPAELTKQAQLCGIGVASIHPGGRDGGDNPLGK